MSFHTYILYSKRIDRFYVGSTAHLQKRLLQHNNRESSYTSAGVPWNLIWSTGKEARFEAEQLERKLKNLTRVRKIRFMKKYRKGIFDEVLLDAIVP